MPLGLNMSRLGGGAAGARRPFYDACDEAGILVWQVGGHRSLTPSEQRCSLHAPLHIGAWVGTMSSHAAGACAWYQEFWITGDCNGRGATPVLPPQACHCAVDDHHILQLAEPPRTVPPMQLAVDAMLWNASYQLCSAGLPSVGPVLAPGPCTVRGQRCGHHPAPAQPRMRRAVVRRERAAAGAGPGRGAAAHAAGLGLR